VARHRSSARRERALHELRRMPKIRAGRLALAAGLAVAALAAFGVWFTLRGAQATAEDGVSLATAHYVGRSACVACHATESALWTGSDHDLAMQVPDA